jgi:hypothetical protein
VLELQYSHTRSTGRYARHRSALTTTLTFVLDATVRTVASSTSRKLINAHVFPSTVTQARLQGLCVFIMHSSNYTRTNGIPLKKGTPSEKMSFGQLLSASKKYLARRSTKDERGKHATSFVRTAIVKVPNGIIYHCELTHPTLYEITYSPITLQADD